MSRSFWAFRSWPRATSTRPPPWAALLAWSWAASRATCLRSGFPSLLALQPTRHASCVSSMWLCVSVNCKCKVAGVTTACVHVQADAVVCTPMPWSCATHGNMGWRIELQTHASPPFAQVNALCMACFPTRQLCVACYFLGPARRAQRGGLPSLAVSGLCRSASRWPCR